jgi:Family of unknown function (DUF6286)
MRLLNRPLALILAIALAGASVIIIAEVIAFNAHHSPIVIPWPTWYHWAEATRWDRRVVQVWAAILIVIGAVLLALELKRPRITRLALRSPDEATDAALTRAGLAGTLRAAATSVDGITGVAVTVRRRRASVDAKSAARGRAAARGLKPAVTEAVQSRLGALNLRRRPRLTVHVSARSR